MELPLLKRSSSVCEWAFAFELNAPTASKIIVLITDRSTSPRSNLHKERSRFKIAESPRTVLLCVSCPSVHRRQQWQVRPVLDVQGGLSERNVGRARVANSPRSGIYPARFR